jgi:hypothetical protein
MVCGNERCVQCINNGDCQGSNLVCSNGACVYPQGDDDCIAGESYIGTANNALEDNPSMPTGYCCPSTCGGSCSEGQEAPNNCPYCVGGVFRCTLGQTFETCSGNSDCSSGYCLDVGGGNKICAEGPDCVYNYNTNISGSGFCTKSAPYCVQGKCSEESIGAWCAGKTNNPDGSICWQIPGVEPNPDNLNTGFCVNNKCQISPGDFNDICVTYSGQDSCMIAQVDPNTGTRLAYNCRKVGNVNRCLI